MNGWRIEMTDEAIDNLAEIPRDQIQAILRAMRQLARNPSTSNIKKLQGEANTWRLRVGKCLRYRAMRQRNCVWRRQHVDLRFRLP